mmetsp:Transcript_36465/g.117516  ORF Transcript_36465/g.117516 Transcript_36465/m.117516 type:complete len:204 (-) Transcript_36465:87-698(-)
MSPLLAPSVVLLPKTSTSALWIGPSSCRIAWKKFATKVAGSTKVSSYRSFSSSGSSLLPMRASSAVTSPRCTVIALASKRGIDLGGPQWRTYSAKDEKSIDEELTAAASVLMLGWISRAIGTNSESVTSASAVCDGLILITTCTARPTSTVRSTTMRKRRHAIARCTEPDVEAAGEAAGARPAFSGAFDMGPFTSWTLSAKFR